ncbi:MAG: alpha/beta fold hydrolase [bacterium]
MKRRKFSIFTEGQSIELDTYTRDAGKELLFFLHGLGCSKDSFHHVWNRPDFDRFSILAPDLVGFGDSTKPESFSYTMEAQARVCAEILAEFSDKNLHIIAHSMGGAVALLLPDQVLSCAKSFVNVEGNLIDADCGILSRKIISVSPAIFKSYLFPELCEEFGHLREKYAAMHSTSADVLYRSAESLIAWSDSNMLLTVFLALPCRKAYFYGDENAAHPTIASIGDVPKVKIKRSGHFSMNDNPEDFYDELYTFLTASAMT